MPTDLPRAPDFETLFRYEESIERAVVFVLSAAGLRAYRSRERAKRSTPCVEVRLLPGKVTGHRGIYAPGMFMLDAWSAQLMLSVVTNRDDAAQAASEEVRPSAIAAPVDHGPDAHALMLGKLRVRMLYATAALQADNPHLIYHYIEKVEEAGSVPRVESAEDLDISPLLYNLVFGIRATAWPLPPE